MVAELIKRLVLAATVVALFVGAWPSSGRISGSNAPLGSFFWAANGSDANDCKSPSTPCQTITHFNAFSFPASPAPMVFFRGGDTFGGGLTNFITGMTISSYGAGQPTFSSGNSTPCMTITNVSGVTINNVICQGGGNTTNTTRGIDFENTGTSKIFNSAVTNSTITGYGLFCVIFFNSNNPGGGYNFVTFNNNTVHDCTGNSAGNAFPILCVAIGFGALGDNTVPNLNITASGNTVFNCNGTAADTTNWSGGGLTITNSTNVTMTHNLVHDTGALNALPGQGPVALQIFNDNGVLIAFNEAYHARGGSTNADGEPLDASNSDNVIVEYNYLHDGNFADILLGTFTREQNNVTIRFNITEQGPQGEFSVHSSCGANGCLGWKIHNNTFVGGGIQTGPNSSGNPFSINFSNNILIGTNGTSTAAANFGSSAGFGGTYVITGNDYSNPTINVTVLGTNYTTLAALQAAGFEKVGATPVGTTANPNLVGTVGSGGNCSGGGLNSTCPAAYKLQSGSPANQPNGVNLFTVYGIDPGQQDFYSIPTESAVLPIGAHMGPTLPATCANQLVLDFTNTCAIIIQPMS